MSAITFAQPRQNDCCSLGFPLQPPKKGSPLKTRQTQREQTAQPRHICLHFFRHQSSSLECQLILASEAGGSHICAHSVHSVFVKAMWVAGKSIARHSHVTNKQYVWCLMDSKWCWISVHQQSCRLWTSDPSRVCLSEISELESWLRGGDSARKSAGSTRHAATSSVPGPQKLASIPEEYGPRKRFGIRDSLGGKGYAAGNGSCASSEWSLPLGK